jgi:23S rRNA (cytosine1962-C5)-methyltransferase
MTAFPLLTLKPGRDVHLRNRHHSIFRVAAAEMPRVEDGCIVEVRSSEGEFLCYATFNGHAYICARAISFEQGDPLQALRRTIKRSIEMREAFFGDGDTTAYRLINAEGDGVPGLIVDRYGDVYVVQCTTLGMDRLKPWVVGVLKEFCGATKIFEKSTGQARRKEGLDPHEAWLLGSGSTDVPVTERGMKFHISLSGSQKTGLFLDQREMRSLVRAHAAGRTMLDCCSYVGGFSLSALMGGALSADAVDYDGAALERAKEHMRLNGIAADQFSTYSEDVFDFLRRKPSPRPYDFIILDPPAFAKRSSDIDSDNKIIFDLKNKPGLSNLLLIFASLSEKPIKIIEKEFSNKNYGEFKLALADLMIKKLSDYRKNKKTLLSKSQNLKNILNSGCKIANTIANKKIAIVKKKIGLSF